MKIERIPAEPEFRLTVSKRELQYLRWTVGRIHNNEQRAAGFEDIGDDVFDVIKVVVERGDKR